MRYPKCPDCKIKMTVFDGVSWYTCPECGLDVRKETDGSFKTRDQIFAAFGKRSRDIEPEEWRKFEDGWRPD